MGTLDGLGFYTQDLGCYKYTHLGTASATGTISQIPAFLSHIQINTVALGTIVIYDSVGTSANVIGSVSITSLSGTLPPNTLTYKIATKTALTITSTANLDLTVAALP